MAEVFGEPKDNERIQKPETFARPEGTYSIVYGDHVFDQNPLKLPKTFDALTVESFSNLDWIKSPQETISWWAEKSWDKNYLKVAGEQNASVYFSDMIIPGMTQSLVLGLGLMAADVGIAMTELFFSAVVLDNLLKERRKVPNRRKFLKGVINMGKGMGALWLASPSTTLLGRFASYATNSELEISAAIKRGSEKLHPEQFLFTEGIRNALFAHKEWWLMTELGTKPHMVNTIGAAHTGLRSAIETDPEVRLGFLERTVGLYKSVILPESFYTVQEFIFTGSSWKPSNKWEIPELKRLIS